MANLYLYMIIKILKQWCCSSHIKLMCKYSKEVVKQYHQLSVTLQYKYNTYARFFFPDDTVEKFVSSREKVPVAFRLI